MSWLHEPGSFEITFFITLQALAMIMLFVGGALKGWWL